MLDFCTIVDGKKELLVTVNRHKKRQQLAYTIIMRLILILKFSPPVTTMMPADANGVVGIS